MKLALAPKLDVENATDRLDGADVRDKAPEPDDEDLRTRRPKRRKPVMKREQKKQKEQRV